MVSVRKGLLQFLFAGSFMKRWNDKHRSMDLVEVDKQAHKMMVAWMLYELNSRHLPEPERLALGLEIVGGLGEQVGLKIAAAGVGRGEEVHHHRPLLAGRGHIEGEGLARQIGRGGEVGGLGAHGEVGESRRGGGGDGQDGKGDQAFHGTFLQGSMIIRTGRRFVFAA